MKKLQHIKWSNPIIKNKFTADPTVLAYQGKVYLYTCHDEAPDASGYKIREWLCFSSSDMVNWNEHTVPLRPADFSWAGEKAFATKIIGHSDRFYWYVAVSDQKDPRRAIGVAVADKPAGPFRDARGSALISYLNGTLEGSYNMDPSVLVDDDGQAHIFWGKHVCYFSRLKSNLIELDGDIDTIDLPEFLEGVHIHKKNGWYYLSYGLGYPEKVGYAMSRSIYGPWEFKGILNDLAYNCETNRPAVLELDGMSFFFYHNGALKGGDSFRRSVCMDYLHYNEDGTLRKVIMTEGNG